MVKALPQRNITLFNRELFDVLFHALILSKLSNQVAIWLCLNMMRKLPTALVNHVHSFSLFCGIHQLFSEAARSISPGFHRQTAFVKGAQEEVSMPRFLTKPLSLKRNDPLYSTDLCVHITNGLHAFTYFLYAYVY